MVMTFAVPLSNSVCLDAIYINGETETLYDLKEDQGVLRLSLKCERECVQEVFVEEKYFKTLLWLVEDQNIEMLLDLT